MRKQVITFNHPSGTKLYNCTLTYGIENFVEFYDVEVYYPQDDSGLAKYAKGILELKEGKWQFINPEGCKDILFLEGIFAEKIEN